MTKEIQRGIPMSEKQKLVRDKAQYVVGVVSEINSIAAVGVMSCRWQDQSPLDGIILGICVIGKIDNKTFNKVISIRDEISSQEELPIIPLPNNDDTEPYDIVWIRKDIANTSKDFSN